MDEFLKAMRGGFADDRSHAARSGLLFGLLILAAALAWLITRAVRASRARAELRAFAGSRSFLDELPLVHEIAERARRRPLEVLEHLDLFEQATRLSLEASGADAQLAAGIERLRRALGYDRLSELMPLFSTRELPASTAVRIGQLTGATIRGSETILSIHLAGTVGWPAGEVVSIEVPHAREVPYQLHCRFLGSAAAGDGSDLSFAHDEGPLRVRHAEARISAPGKVALRSALVSNSADAMEMNVELLEASSHELLVSSVLKLPAGRLFDCSFSLGQQRFFKMRALALAEEPGVHPQHRVRLELRGLSEQERLHLREALDSIQPGSAIARR